MARYSFLLALATIAACSIPGAAPPSDTMPPTGTVLINNDDSYTVSTSVTLALSAADDDPVGVTQMRVSNTADFTGAGWQSFAASLAWTLTDGDGPKTVYAAFRDAAGNPSEVSSDSIALDTTLPGPPDRDNPRLVAAVLAAGRGVHRNHRAHPFRGFGQPYALDPFPLPE